jgi:hypothetical protein
LQHGLGSCPIHRHFKYISRFKPHDPAGCNRRFLARFGIATDPGAFGPHVKGPETPQDDGVPLLQSALDLVEDRIHRFFGLDLSQIRRFRNAAHDFGFPHSSPFFSSPRSHVGLHLGQIPA